MATKAETFIGLGLPAALAQEIATAIDASAQAAVDALQIKVVLSGTANGTGISTGAANPREVDITTTA